jgi:hypothetical protein
MLTIPTPTANHAEELHHLAPSIAGSLAPVLCCMPVRRVLFQDLPEEDWKALKIC